MARMPRTQAELPAEDQPVETPDGQPLDDAFEDADGAPLTADEPAAEELPPDVAYAMAQRQRRKAAHDAWAAGLIADGWAYGPALDEANRTHPALAHYDQLSTELQLAYDQPSEAGA